jgi:integrase
MSRNQKSKDVLTDAADQPTEKKKRPTSYWKVIKGNLYARLQYRDESGKWKEKVKPITDKRTARSVVESMRRELEQHGEETLLSDKVTFKQLADKYEKAKVFAAESKDGRKIAGMKSYKSQQSHLKVLKDYFGSQLIRSIKPSDIEAFKRKRLNAPVEIEINVYKKVKDEETGKEKKVVEKAKKQRPRKIASVNRELAMLRAMFYFAIREGWMLQNPTTRVKSLISLASEESRERVLSFDEERRLLATCTGRREHLRAVLIVALDTAMRPEEIYKLRWEHVSFDDNAIYLTPDITKTEKGRIVPFLTVRIKDEFKNLWNSSPQRLKDLVFGIKSIKTAFNTARRESGLDNFRFRDARHTATTRMINAGMNYAEVMKITGHDEMKTFLRYLNITPESARIAPLKLETYLNHAQNQLLNECETIN